MREIVDGVAWVPRTCTWELTLRCNLRCGHCGSRAGAPRAHEMDRANVLRVVGELAEAGCRRVTLSGGEPSLSPHWEAVAAEGARRGMKMNMITNGVDSSRELVRRAKDAGLVNLGVSIDGTEPEHDRFRGMKGLHGRVMDLLESCKAEGLPVGAITTITKGNMHELDRIRDGIAGRVFGWQLQIGAAMGNLRDHREEQIAPEDLLEVIPAVASLIRSRTVDIRVADNVGYFGPYEEVIRQSRQTPIKHWLGCYAGCRHVGLQADGGVKGCLSLQASEATEGNLQHESLAAIWRRKGAFAYTRGFEPSDLTGFCRTCEYAVVCRGGCLSMRTCEGGGENPFCYHRVATLAMRRKERRSWHYVPIAIAPAAVIASLGIGCTSHSETRAIYGAPCPEYCGSTEGDAGQDAIDLWDGTFIYGEWTPPDDAQADVDTGVEDAGTDAADAEDAGEGGADVDLDVVDKYGFPAPDAAEE